MQHDPHGPKFVPIGGETVPLRRYLPEATAAAILRRHQLGGWGAELPSERRMCAELKVSRGTLRQALHILRGGGMLQTESGCGHRLLKPRRRKKRRPQATIRFLSPEPLESRRAFFSLLLDRIHDAADARGWKLRRDHGASYFGARHETSLERLVSESPDDCWILVHANERVQRWFSARAVPAIVSGHTYPEVDLPSLDVDHGAAARHAANTLLRHGHRRVAMIVSRNPLPGLRAGESGFKEGFLRDPVKGAHITRLVHSGRDAGLVKQVRELFSGDNHPTAVLVETPNQYITALSTLARLRLIVPEDVSLISRLDDPFMQYFEPEPARYRVDPVLFSKTLVTMVSHLLAGEALQPRAREIVPEFLPGRSVAAPRNQGSRPVV